MGSTNLTFNNQKVYTSAQMSPMGGVDPTGNPVVAAFNADGTMGGGVRVRHEFHCDPTQSVTIPITALAYIFFITGTGNDTTVGSNTAHAAGTAESVDYGLSAPLTLTAGAAAYIDGVYLTAA